MAIQDQPAWLLLLMTLSFGAASGADVDIMLVDPEASHIHAPGSPFVLEVTASDPGLPGAKVFAQWVNAESSPVETPIELPPGHPIRLSSPGSDLGYWGLYFFSNDERVALPPQTAGLASQEYGFAILAPRTFAQGRLEPDSFFGMVHPNIGSDPNLVGGAKTLSWNTTGAHWWKKEIRLVRQANLEELPLVSGPTWQSDDSRPITSGELDDIALKFDAYLSAVPDVDEWELGREENLGDTYNQPHYFTNLAAKVKRLRQVANARNKAVRFAYQFVNFKTKKLQQLIGSGVLDHFQILSLHPYPWPDFPSPETWFSAEVKVLRTQLKEAGYGNIEIWITEIGLPVRGNRDPNGFFGYPASGKRVPGASRDYAARYLVKCHAFAALEDIKRLYVYNYQDRGNDIRAAEDHFGLRSYTGDKTLLGYPKQAYVAYVQMLQELHGKKLVRMINPRNNIYVFDYQGQGDSGLLLTWVYPEGSETINLAELWPAQSEFRIKRLSDLYGKPITDWEPNKLRLTGQPVYVEYVFTSQAE